MAGVEQAHTFRFPLPHLIVRGVAHTIKAPVYLDGGLVPPSSGTVSVYNASNTAVVDAQAVTVSGSIAQYAIGAGDLTSEAFGENWRVEWSLVIDTVTYTARNDAALVRAVLYPVVSDLDLIRRVPAIDPHPANSITSANNHQETLDEAWVEIQLRLIAAGNRPNLIMSPYDLRQVHLLLALAILFEDLALTSGSNEVYSERAAEYRRQYEDAWKMLKFMYDPGDDGYADSPDRRSGVHTLWLSSGGRRVGPSGPAGG